MKNLSVTIGNADEKNSYEVITGSGILKKADELIPCEYLSGTIAIITDSNVEKLYAQALANSLKNKAKHVITYTFEAGENSKSLVTLGGILEFLAANAVTRSDLIIAVGGGVVGDIAGFAAGIYLRGTPFIGVPTTFLSAVDSSVGGKTGINLQGGKNLAGVFNRPKLVLTDTDAFKTLSDDYFSDGIAETLKHGIIADENLFNAIALNNRQKLMTDINMMVKRNIEIKAEIVSDDEFDRGNRQLLNLGHTIGHAIEKCGNYKIPHGRAVAAGIAIISRAANRLGYLPDGDTEKIHAALRFHGFKTTSDFTNDELLGAALYDKKRNSDKINLVMPKRIGECFLLPTPVEKLGEIIALGKE